MNSDILKEIRKRHERDEADTRTVQQVPLAESVVTYSYAHKDRDTLLAHFPRELPEEIAEIERAAAWLKDTERKIEQAENPFQSPHFTPAVHHLQNCLSYIRSVRGMSDATRWKAEAEAGLTMARS